MCIRLRVLDIASQLFAERGCAETALIDVVRGSGVATATIYQHFGEKEAVFREVIFAHGDSYGLDHPSIEPDDTVFAALDRAGNYIYQVTYSDRSIGLMRLMIAEANRFPELVRSVVTSIFAHVSHNIEKVFECLEANDLIPASDHVRSAELFSNLVLSTHPILP